MMNKQGDISCIYNLVMNILLDAEGDKNPEINFVSHFSQKTHIRIPSLLLPLLHAGSYSIKIASRFLPYYFKNNFFVHQQFLSHDFKDKLLHDDLWNEIYHEFLKFLITDTLRTIPVAYYSKPKTRKQHKTHKVFLYDSKTTQYPPYYGIDIYNFFYNDNNDIKSKQLYLIGNISQTGLDFLIHKKITQNIYGITPLYQFDNQNQARLHERLSFFSNTILAGSLNIQLPFLEHYFKAGLAPFSFYDLLYRFKTPHIIMSNALCLLNNQYPMLNLEDYLNYQKILPHTDLSNVAFDNNNNNNNNNKNTEKVNYLRLLSVV